MTTAATIENGFAGIGAGRWLLASTQPVAYSGEVRRVRRKGWFVRDRGFLSLVELSSSVRKPTKGASAGEAPKDGAVWAKCSCAGRPFLTHIPCAAELFAVSEKVLLAPAESWKAALTVKPVPVSARFSFCTTQFSSEWVVLATRSRTIRLALAEGETVSVRPEAVAAWTTKMPTGFCPRLSLWDLLLPRGPAQMALTFYGPGVVWIEGAADRRTELLPGRRPRNAF